MEEMNNGTENLFSLPVALIFQNESAMNHENEFVYNATTSSLAVNQSSQDWKKEVVTGGLQRLEKLGDVIRRELKWAFILHTYGFGCLFFILAFYTFFSILNIRSFISSRPFMSTINGFLCLLGTTRAASLFIDPYNLKEVKLVWNMPRILGQVLWDLGFPSIISAFCLVQLAFLQLTQLQVGLEGLRRKSCLSLIVTAHFLLTIGMDIIVASHENLMIVKLIFHYIFLTWGVFLCANFLYTGYKVMSMIRNIPGGLNQRDLPDPSYKGIMQLAILAPHHNLAGSMTAALLPTLCTPKIHQQDNTGLSAVGFRNDGNSRILESESIPMLEEMTGSSGDEVSPKPMIRGSSFQNQTRNSQKFNLKPKLSLKSSSSDLKDEDSDLGKLKSPKSATPKNQSPKKFTGKANEFNFNVKPVNGILKHTENFVSTKSIHDFKLKVQHRTSFENENFRFSNDKAKAESAGTDVIPNILVSGPGSSENLKNFKDEKNKQKNKSLNKLMNEISKDLNEMQMIREEKGKKLEEIVQVHELKKEKRENEGKKESVEGRKIIQSSEKESHRNSCRKDYEAQKAATTLTEIIKLEESQLPPAKVRGRKKSKSLSWKKRLHDQEEEIATQECLLPQENPTDVTLRSVLNHIAYMNRGLPTGIKGEDDLEKVRKSKVEWVLNITYITAMWGLMLCLSNMGKIYSPFGVPDPRKAIYLNSTIVQDGGSSGTAGNGILFSSWPWLWFQTFCRALELAMGCAMANITRQPAANHRYPRPMSFRYRDTFYAM